FETLSKFNWHYAGGYARRNKRLPNGKRRMEFMHRVISDTPKEMYTDHIDGNTLNNRKSNLRNVSQSQNTKNARQKYKATTEHNGAYYFRRNQDMIGKREATIQRDEKQVGLGYFKSEIEAALAYNEAAIQEHKEYASLNEVEFM